MATEAGKTDYAYAGAFNRTLFLENFTAQFSEDPSYDKDVLPDLQAVLGRIELDKRITDIRWAAYMLATVMWETRSLKRTKKAALDKKGKPLMTKLGKPVLLSVKKWVFTMAPVREVGRGKGRDYYEPVKVKVQKDGKVRVTEQDGDQFIVNAAGNIKPLTEGAAQGSPTGGDKSSVYVSDDGAELAYYGRGYVQLTWWSNYATTGVAIGKGLELLLEPDLVKQPEVAFAVMAQGMIKGSGFANGHRCSEYFGKETDYIGARAMVNGSNHAEDIAAMAEQFENILLESRGIMMAPSQ